MSNKGKLQPPSQQQQHQHQKQQQTSGLEPLPPRYQPPPQPCILKAQSGFTAANSAALNQHHLHLQQQQHQQQAARLANQVKEAVQSKFAQKIELPHNQAARTEKLQGGYAQQQQQQQAKGFLVPGGPGSVTPSAVVANAVSQGTAAPRQRITDDEFLRLGPVEMLKFVRKTEGDMARLAAEQHRQIQSLLNELRVLKEANQRLSDDNQELRDLCCFLDDDRQKGRKLAREWQRFGRYTASVMRQEVSAYQNKLRQLDNKQQELIKDNLELKELCLYLDEERGGGTGGAGGGQRDDGDGSSSSTNADESAPAPPRVPRHQQHVTSSTSSSSSAGALNDQTMQYVRSLEQRVKQLEEDKSILQARSQAWPPGPNEPWLDHPRPPPPPPPTADEFHLGSRPEAVVRALQVLEVREQLEREAGHDGEKALVREMCNVVWRKLEEGPTQNRH